MTPFTLDTGSLSTAFAEACARLDTEGVADLLWHKRASAWPGDAATQGVIANRLGWVTALDFVTPHLPRLRAFAERVCADGFTDVVLLGMGGSSLAPEVLRQVLGVAPGHPRFRILDSVDPDEVRSALVRASTTLFVLASKSGSTIEPNAMAAEAARRVEAAGLEWGTRVVAITDEGTSLHARATREHFRDIFVNPSDIGGRYSGLSFFGLVPAALMGADLNALVAGAREMETACRRSTAAENPGFALGAFMAAGALHGRDKLTLILPDGLASFGLWVEQLVAESTGKQGVGVIPIAGESSDVPFGLDRLVVAVSIDSAALGAAASPAGSLLPSPADLDRARAAGAPVMRLTMSNVHGLGAEFLRWEVATTAAGLLLTINPFDEPNVAEAKAATRTCLNVYIAEGRLPDPEPFDTIAGLRVSMSRAARALVGDDPRGSVRRLARPGDYVGLLPYLPPSHAEFEQALTSLRRSIGTTTGCATMWGYGPRYLHSTGQLHKGGPDSGVFVIVTANGAEDLAIPDEAFSFGVLEAAQALGDFTSLGNAGRRAIYVHLPRREPALIADVAALLLND
jgi:glucose-6-phosphate isomerase